MSHISAKVGHIWQSDVAVAERDYTIQVVVDSPAPVELCITTEAVAHIPDTYLVRLELKSSQDCMFYIENFVIAWQVPATDVHGLYFGGNPLAELSYLPFWTMQKDVGAQTGLPFMALIHRNGENRMAYGLLDQLTETRLQADLSEITRCYHMKIQKPANKNTNQQRIPVTGTWEEVFFISHAKKRWPSVLTEYVQQATDWVKQPIMPVPDHAYDPVFCTWTAIHHDVSHAWIMKNAPLAAELGFRTWLTDDGWFLDKGEFANYEHVGEWVPNTSKFPDFKAHVAAVKELGFRYVLWVTPFMIGVNSKKAEQYSHLLTDGQEPERFHNLSPWHTETADIVKDLLKRLVEDYELDGLKIDFIDSISVHSKRLPRAGEQSLGTSVYRILQESIDELISIQPDLLIEFRNSYTNLASRRYANLYRSSDVPINFALNRWQAVMLRLLVPDRAVHMDPMLWHPDDTDENVAVNLINGIASVPMISIELDEYPQAHLDLIRYWIGFYNTHRQTIIHGDFRPQLRSTYIPVIDFIGEHEVITGLYDDMRVTIYDSVSRQWVLNASTRPFVELEAVCSGPIRVIGRNKVGFITYDKSYDSLPPGLEIEVGGSVEIVS